MGHIREYSRSEMQNLLLNMNYKIINKSFAQYKVSTNGKLKTMLFVGKTKSFFIVLVKTIIKL